MIPILVALSPLFFLAIPFLVFMVGSTVLWAASRWRHTNEFVLRRTPDELRTVAPTVRDQRRTGWQSGVSDQRVRG